MTRQRPMAAGEFANAEDLQRAARTLAADGVRLLDACTPYEVPGMRDLLDVKHSVLPTVVFAAGLAGGVIGYGIQWYVNAFDYPLNAGGRPPHAVPSFVFVTFESIVICAAGALFFALLWVLRLPRYYHVFSEIDGFERVSADRFWLMVPENDADQLSRQGPLRIVSVEYAP